ncbi:unnamed protein product [Linum trigynum]|uniref:Uncharacterized protein n=1 Tax=Linum trigynum TaxID=586398 RepID=A0AAV2GNU3_9ROSI
MARGECWRSKVEASGGGICGSFGQSRRRVREDVTSRWSGIPMRSEDGRGRPRSAMKSTAAQSRIWNSAPLKKLRLLVR